MAKKREDRVRVTVSIRPEVLDMFKEMAAVGGISVGRAIGEWCADTVEGAMFVTSKVLEARKSPAKVMQDWHNDSRSTQAWAQGVDLVARSQGRARVAPQAATASGSRTPRHVIRGESRPPKGGKR
jgi:hypothetical protein